MQIKEHLNIQRKNKKLILKMKEQMYPQSNPQTTRANYSQVFDQKISKIVNNKQQVSQASQIFQRKLTYHQKNASNDLSNEKQSKVQKKIPAIKFQYNIQAVKTQQDESLNQYNLLTEQQQTSKKRQIVNKMSRNRVNTERIEPNILCRTVVISNQRKNTIQQDSTSKDTYCSPSPYKNSVIESLIAKSLKKKIELQFSKNKQFLQRTIDIPSIKDYMKNYQLTNITENPLLTNRIENDQKTNKQSNILTENSLTSSQDNPIFQHFNSVNVSSSKAQKTQIFNNQKTQIISRKRLISNPEKVFITAKIENNFSSMQQDQSHKNSLLFISKPDKAKTKIIYVKDQVIPKEMISTKLKQINKNPSDIWQEIPYDNLEKERYVTNILKSKIEDIEIGKCLGKGRFGNVYMIRDKKTSFVCALKVISKQLLKESKMEYQIQQEIKIQSYANHPNILKMYGMFHDNSRVFLLLELASHGDLMRELKRQPEQRYSEPIAAYYVKQVCDSLVYLHSIGVIHRDIKPENIMINYGILKLSDFGWSIYTSTQRTTFCGTLDYVSPEVIQGKNYDFSVDLWSIGVLTYELITGCAPFDTKKQSDAYENIVHMKYSFPKFVSYEAKQFINNFLVKDPKKRISIDQALDNPWLVKYNQLIQQQLSKETVGTQFFQSLF